MLERRPPPPGEHRLRAVLEANQDAAWYFEFSTGITTLSDQWYRMLGYAPGEVEATPEGWLGLVHPDDLPDVRAAMQAHLEGRTEQFVSEHRLRTKDGRWLWTLDRGKVVERDAEGRPVIAAGSHTDISDRKAAEAALHQRMQELADLKFALDQAAIVATTDAAGVILEANERFQDISGYSRGELVGRTHRILKSGAHSPAFYSEMWRTIRSGRVWHGEIRNRAKDGTTYWVDTTIVPLQQGPDGPGKYLSIRFDISERHRAEDRLRRTQGHLMEAIESIPGGFAIFDAEDRLSLCNQEFLERLPEALRGKAPGTPFEALLRNGMAEVPPADDEDPEALVQEGLACHRGPGRPFIYAAADGRTFRTLTRATPEGGRAALTTDITAERRREAELIQAREAAETANRLKDQFVALLTHELRSPLQSVLGFAELLQRGSEASKAGYVQHILSSGARMLDLINDLLDLARIQEGRMDLNLGDVALEPLLARIQDTLQPLAQPLSLRVLREGDAGLSVRADARRLEQVLLNLGSNAVKYNRPSGSVTLRCRRLGGCVRLEVEDTGLGIPEDRQHEVFEAFNRLGREGGPAVGTGLGLHLARRLVEQMGGRIGFQSRPETGSTFWMEFPAGESPQGD